MSTARHANRIFHNARRNSAVLAALGAMTFAALAGSGPAEAWTPTVPTLDSQVPFVIEGSADNVGVTISVDGDIYGITATTHESDFITWASCDEGFGPSRVPVTALIDRLRRTLDLHIEVVISKADQHCILNSLTRGLDSHVAFFPQEINPRLDSYFLKGEFVVDGVVVS